MNPNDANISRRLLLGSGGLRTPEKVDAWKQELDNFAHSIDEILFIPYAIKKWDWYVERIQQADLHVGRKTIGIHTMEDPVDAINNAKAIHVGGGNSFRLLHELQNRNLLQLIREKALSGMLYIGISAGSNMACPTIQTTNDMPIVHTSNFDALNLIDFQINPHYVDGPAHHLNSDGELEPFGGESRDDRLREYHEMNERPVLALYEGSILRVEGDQMTLKGVGGAKLFSPSSEEPILCSSGDEIEI